MNTPAGSYQFAPEERPVFPGSPFTPRHPGLRRIGYAAIAALAGVASTFGNGMVSVNVANLAGNIGLYAFEASLLPAIYVSFNASANLMLVKGRAQFGIPAITQGLLTAYAGAALVQALFPNLGTAILTRAFCGMTAAALITYGIYNWMQVLPAKARPLALVLGITMPQLGLPLARLLPVDMLAQNNWQGLSLIELALASALLAATTALPLPPSERSKAFRPLDFVTYPLVLFGMLLFCIAISEGRLLWWTDTPWLGRLIALSIPLLCAAVLVETGRAKPLLQLKWIGSLTILRFAAVALFVRLALAEQTYGAVGILVSGGLTNDQLHLLFLAVAGAMLLGAVAVALTLSERRLPYQVIAAALIIAAGAWLDSSSTNLTRPPQLYLSQALIGFGTTLFIGPALIYGFLQMFQRGAEHLVSFIVLFSTTQNVGSLIGTAMLGSLHTIFARNHAQALSEHLVAADPQVAARLQSGSASISSVVQDPALRLAEGGALLGRQLAREASILAFNDIFRFIAWFAIATAAYVFYLSALRALSVRTARGA